MASGYLRLTACGLSLLLWVAAGCEAPIAAPEPTPPVKEPVEDLEGPLLETEPITAPQSLDEPILIEASATDPSGVYVVYLHYRPQNTSWRELRMEEASEGGGFFQAWLSASMLAGAGSVSYYLEAADGTPYHNTTYSPTSGEDGAWRFNLLTE